MSVLSRASSFGRLLAGRGRSGPEAREIRYYLRVTLLVALGLGGGAVLQWADAPAWRWLPLGLAYAAGGMRIAQDSWRELKRRRLSIDFLMGLAAAGAALVGRPLEGAILIFLFSLSKLLETYAMDRTRQAITRLVDLRPQEAVLADESGSACGRIDVHELTPGQLILVRPGERIAADGLVVSGRSEVDQAAMTGESRPVRKDADDEVFAGTLNQGGALVVRVTRHAGETMLARIIRLVEEAREQRAPAQHFIDRFAHPYTLAVVCATIALAVLQPLLFHVAWSDAFYRAMTLLVVASPCALVISTPSAILSGIANGARHGILFKGGAYLDLAGTIDTVAFDKTGTLTRGRPDLLELVAAAEGDRERVLALAAAVERLSEHHLARAVLAAARARGLEPAPIEHFRSQPGVGVSGRVDGAMGWVGNVSMASGMEAPISAALLSWAMRQNALGRSVVYVGSEETTLGAMAFGDALRPGAAVTLQRLRKEGVGWIAILSGDHPDAVRAIGTDLGADEVRAGLMPDEKVHAVRSLAANARGVAMVGDGVNDAPAMAAATLGIAMGAMGTDVAIETADVVLMSDDLTRVGYLIHLGKRARRVVRQNVAFSIGWMGLLVLAALTVGIPLTLAVVAHEGSTLLVALNGLRLLAGHPDARHGSRAATARVPQSLAGATRLTSAG